MPLLADFSLAVHLFFSRRKKFMQQKKTFSVRNENENEKHFWFWLEK
jgi:hypothetical protein